MTQLYTYTEGTNSGVWTTTLHYREDDGSWSPALAKRPATMDEIEYELEVDDYPTEYHEVDTIEPKDWVILAQLPVSVFC